MANLTRRTSKLIFTNQQVCLLQQLARTSTITNHVLKPFEAIPCEKIPFLPRSWNLLLSGGAGYLHEHCDKLHKQLGPIFRERLGLNELVFLADVRMMQIVIANEGPFPQHNVPEAWLMYNKIKNIERGLFFQVGEPWAKLRKAFNRVLLANPRNVARFGQEILDINSQFLNNLSNRPPNHENKLVIRDLKHELCKWSIETTGSVLFGARLGCISSPNGAHGIDRRAERLVESVANMFKETSKFQVIPCKLAHRFNLPTWQRFERASSEMIDIASDYAREFIHKSKHDNGTRASLVRDLIDLNQLTDEEISRSMTDLIIAATDTTSNSVQWMFYLIAKHQKLQAELLKEADELLGKSDIDWNNLRRTVPLLHAFMKEVSRLYPTAPFLARTLKHEIGLGGFKVPAGVPIVFSLYSTSRMAKYFDDPLEFKPERWLRARERPSNAYASLPFGIGARMCIGRRVAELESVLLIAAFVKMFKSELPPGMADVGVELNMILGPDRPIILILKRR